MKFGIEQASLKVDLSTAEIQPERIRFQGDPLERHFSERILHTIPMYATIWTTYIGNDGGAHSLPMLKTSRVIEQNRSKFWESAYTLFESLSLCWKLEEEFNQREKIKNFEDYMCNLNAWIAFYAHLGRIFDMAQDISFLLNEKVPTSPIKEFFDRRCIVLHGPKVPMKWLDNVLLAPPLGERPGHWHDKMHWVELSAEQFNFITNQVGKILNELEPLINTFFGRVLGLLECQLGLSSVIWPSSVSQSRPDETTPDMITSSCGHYEQMPGSGLQPYQSKASGSQDISGVRGGSQLFDGD